jgi:transposase InsO family protein
MLRLVNNPSQNFRRRVSLFRVCRSTRRELRLFSRGVVLDFDRPGKPTDNAFIEAFNGRLRSGCLDAHWFMNLPDPRKKLEAWRVAYNQLRPHSVIGNKAPQALMNHPAVIQSSRLMKAGKLQPGMVQSFSKQKANRLSE